MIETGIYEQIINSLFKSKIESADDSAFFIENKKIGREEAATILSRYLYQVLQKIFASLPDDDTLSSS